MKKNIIIPVIILAAFLGAVTFLGATQRGREMWNEYIYRLRKVDETTDYGIKKEVENACRAMIASYTSDKLTWEQYKNGESEEKNWANQAKIRANKTAATYNEYVIKNSYVWRNNMPEDVKEELDYIEE